MKTSSASGVPVSAVQQLLFIGRSKDFQLTTDQALTKTFSGTSYIITKVLAVCKTGGATVACAGGIYPAASKAGTALVGVAQSWVTLTAAGKMVDATLAAVIATDVQSATPILSLTTGSTAAVTADVFVYGVVVD